MMLSVWNYMNLLKILFISWCTKTCISSELDRNDFDILTFAQSWPITHCITWMDAGSDNACSLPLQRNTWTIHGVWPTKLGTLGPYYCDSSPLNVSALEPLKDELKKFWPNSHKGFQDDWFWKYEWQKHGTCARNHDALNTEVKYFSKGLEWSQRYSIGELLSKSNIQPGAGYNYTSIYNALKSTLNGDTMIRCASTRNHPNEQYLDEIRICFDIELTLVDCNKNFVNNSKDSWSFKTNCNLNQPIYYPNALPKHIYSKPSKSIWQVIWDNLSKSAIWFRF